MFIIPLESICVVNTATSNPFKAVLTSPPEVFPSFLAKGLVHKINKAEVIKQVAEAKAQEIQMVYDAMMKAKPDEKLVQLKSLETLKEVANGEANKVFIPFEATNTLSSLGAITEVIKEKK